MSKIEQKNWDKEFEKEILEKWQKEDKFKFDEKSDKKIYSIDTPPPYVNKPIHIGQATTYVLMDMFARYKRSKGFRVLFPLGLDRNGLPIETAAEEKYNVKLTDVSREKAIEYCEKILESSSDETIDSFYKLGVSFNSYDKEKDQIGSVYYTDSDEYRSLTQSTFIDLWNKGMIHFDDRVNNYCPGCKTTLADSEVEYDTKNSTFNHVTFKCKETGEDIVIATTRPELICSVGMLIFNPEDDRYSHLDGKTAITPIYGKEVPIKAHPQAKSEKGTGLVMMASFGDLADVRFFRENEIDPIIAIDIDGKMNENAGFLEGLSVENARKEIIKRLKEEDLIIKQEHIAHRTPICERSKDEIEFIGMKELYLKQLDFKDDIKEISKEVDFYDPSSRDILNNWIESLKIDWPISRRRFYATEIPLWYCTECNHAVLPKEKGKYYKPWAEDSPYDECPECGNDEFVGEKRVFDTWFDSSISPLYNTKYERDDEFFKKSFPMSLRPQGKEIVRTWLYYTLLRNYQLTEKPAFEDVWVNYHILDDNGLKMSKSKGNVIDPQEILKEYGAEPFRLWAAVEGDLTTGDFRCSFDRIKGASKTINKMWNVARYLTFLPDPNDIDSEPEYNELDYWIRNEVNKLVKMADEKYDDYDFHTPATNTKHFLWETFASHYLEMAKKRAYGDDGFSESEQMGALLTLRYVLKRVLRIFHPIIPIVTTKLYKAIYGKDLIDLDFVEFEEVKSKFETEEITNLNSNVWKYKKENGIKLRDEVEMLEVPEKFKVIKKDIEGLHHPKEIDFIETEKVNVR
ncbi:MAG: valine--tRNA ligase [Candidatus Woesearchaeota archaeon]